MGTGTGGQPAQGCCLWALLPNNALRPSQSAAGGEAATGSRQRRWAFLAAKSSALLWCAGRLPGEQQSEQPCAPLPCPPCAPLPCPPCPAAAQREAVRVIACEAHTGMARSCAPAVGCSGCKVCYCSQLTSSGVTRPPGVEEPGLFCPCVHGGDRCEARGAARPLRAASSLLPAGLHAREKGKGNSLKETSYYRANAVFEKALQ